MIFITTTCPDCGVAEIPLSSVVLRVNTETARSQCAIRCTSCGARFTKKADDGMSLLLETFGVKIEEWSRPAEVDERPEHLPPIQRDELDAFAEALHSAEDLAALLAK